MGARVPTHFWGFPILKEHPKARPPPLSFETARRPSKMITLRALTVLSRVN
ncbi:MAG: hypothetical protein WA688_05660 [Thermoplasmata archaeon]